MFAASQYWTSKKHFLLVYGLIARVKGLANSAHVSVRPDQIR